MKEKLNFGLFSKYRTELYGIATVMILIFHSQVTMVHPGWFNAINIHLNYGVDVFLFLSGISLYFSYSKDNNYGRFMKKRFERTLLPYLIIGFLFWGWKYIIAQFSIADFLYNVSGLSLVLVKKDNLLTVGQPEIWYVAFILGLYAVYPLFYKYFYNIDEKRKNISLAVFLVISVAAALFVKLYVSDTYNSTEVWLTRIPVFILGCYFGKTVMDNRPFCIQDIILFVMVIPLKAVTLLLGSVFDSKMMLRYLGLFGALFVCFIAVSVFEKFNLKPIRKIFSFFGNLSLEIYIIHVMLYKVLLYYVPDIRTVENIPMISKGMIYAGIVVVSIILSLLFKKITDKIIVRIK